MAIQNIQGLVDKNGLTYISSYNFLSKYYDTALANLGQRNTNDSSIENITFDVSEIFGMDNVKLYVIYDGEHFYTLNDDYTYEDLIDISGIQNAIQESLNNNNNKILSVNTNNGNDKNDVILNKRLNIIHSLYITIFGENSDEKNKLFIPKDYKFGYIANSINKSLIYYSFKDICVNVLPQDFSSDEDDYELDFINYYTDNIFYCENQKFIKTDLYDYFFSTDSDGNDEIKCLLKFTLPYINNDNYWVINNKETKIQAKAHDASNLNIILAKYSTKGDKKEYNFLSGLNKNFNTKIITLENNISQFNIKSGDTIIKCGIRLPKIDENSIKNKENIILNNILQNSTLIIIATINDIIDDDNQNLSDNDDIKKIGSGYITTLWNYGENGFECICDGDIAMDLNKLTNFDNLLNFSLQNIDQIKPDNYLHRYVIFDQIYQQLKQDTNKQVYSYPVLQNIKGSQYNNKYTNNMNFSLKYINFISGDINKDIKGVSNGSDIKYFKNINNIINVQTPVTNSLYQYTTNNKVNYYNEYIPNYNVPLFDLSEILIKDINAINKYNIITFANDGTSYYSYIGSSHNSDKGILTIGTSNLNINLGENTLIDYNTKSQFLKQKKLNIDFDSINANGNLHIKKDLEVKGNINLNNFEWHIYKNENNEVIKSTAIIPQFKYYQNKDNLYLFELDINNLISNVREIESNINTTNNNILFGSTNAKQYLYICPIIKVTSDENGMVYYYKHNDLLVLENLINYLGLNPNKQSIKFKFESNTNEIITINGNQKYLISSNSILSNYINIVSSTETGVTTELKEIKDIYYGNMLYITYIESEHKLIIDEVQSNKINSIWKLPTNI